MSHISGPLKWTNGTFLKYEKSENGLHLFLFDGTSRTMLYQNWEDSFPSTLRKLKALRINTDIRFATWNGYDELKWFCDVEKFKFIGMVLCVQ